MKLYIDDDSVERLLLRLLRDSGHDVETPAEVGMAGAQDAVQLRHAVEADRILISRNYNDFLELHKLVRVTGGSHTGILIVSSENDSRRDLKPRGIVRALENLITSRSPLKNQVTILNHWR